MADGSNPPAARLAEDLPSFPSDRVPRPQVTVGRRMPKQLPVDFDPMMGRRHLSHEVGERFDSDAIRFERDNASSLSRREATELRYEDFDNEEPTVLQMCSSIVKDRQLLVLRGHIRDGVPNDVHELERTGHSSRRHIADGDRDLVCTGLGIKLFQPCPETARFR